MQYSRAWSVFNQIDAPRGSGYNFIALGIRLAVGQQTLDASKNELVQRFIASRREGLSPLTLKNNYGTYLRLSKEVIGLDVTGEDIQHFISTRTCTDGGKHAYFRNLRAFYNWLYSRKSGFNLNTQDNPILNVDPPKVERKILPSLSVEQVEQLVEQAKCVRDKAIVSLFADSGLRLRELVNIDPRNIDWQHRLIKVKCKGKKEGLAVFGARTESLLKEWRAEYKSESRLWDIGYDGISNVMRRLMDRNGLPGTCHIFRRTFASILAKRNVDSLHIMRLGRWSSMQMVERYTSSVKFEDSLKLYEAIVS